MWLDNASSIDMLFYSPYAETIVQFAKNENLTPLTIGLYGSWGAGKSSLLKIIEERLAKEDRIVCVSLNAWQFEGYEDAKIAIMESLLKALNENKKFLDKAKDSIGNLIKRVNWIKMGKNLAKKGLPYALGALTGNPLPIALNLSADIKDSSKIVDEITKFKNDYIKEPDDSSETENIRKFREEFANMLKKVDTISNLTVIIDDLDRCAPDRIIDTLEAIKLFLSVEKTTFIIAVDQRIIEYAVKAKYNTIDGYEISSDYIEKIIQLPIKIPELSPKDIENYLLLLICQLHFHTNEFQKLIDFIYSEKLLLKDKAIEFNQIEEFVSNKKLSNYCSDVDDFKNDACTIEKIRGAVSYSLKGNPRQAKRFLNTFFVRKRLSVLYFDEELDIAIIAKLLALETIDIKLFKKLNEWNNDSKDKENKQLKHLEEYAQNLITEINDELKYWDKPRIIRWLKSEPTELYKHDLSKYFYLSREALENHEDISSAFNEKEREMLNSILNLKEGQEDTRITELQRMSEDSQEKIIGSVLQKFKVGEVKLSLISLIYVNYQSYQSDICDIIKTKGQDVLNIGALPQFRKMYSVNKSQIADLFSFLKEKKIVDEKFEKAVLEPNSIFMAVKRGEL